MRKTIVLILVVAAFNNAATAAIPDGMVYSHNTVDDKSLSCTQWIESRAKGASVYGRVQAESWMSGFISAIGTFVPRFNTQTDFLYGMTDASIFLWLDNYCQVKPLSDLRHPGDALIAKLAQWKITHGVKP